MTALWKRSNPSDAILLCAATLGVAYLCVAAFAMGLPGTVIDWTTARRALPDAATHHTIDDVARRAMPPAGNVIVNLPELARTKDVEPEAVLRFYARATYTLWPRRMYPAAPGAVVITGNDLAATSPPSDPRWLADHDVHAAVRIGPGPTSVQRTPIPPAK